MKKFFLLAALVAFTATAANAQWSWNLRYQGDVELGYSIGVGNTELLGYTIDTKIDRINIHTTHGVRFNEYLFAGLGTGIDIYQGGDFGLPVYLALKGYWPVTQKVSPYLGLDLGGSIGLSEYMYNGLLCVPHIGVAFNVGQGGNAITFGFGFTVQKWNYKESGIKIGYNTNAVSFKVGFQF